MQQVQEQIKEKLVSRFGLSVARWVYGLLQATIQGGASSVVTVTAGMITDPAKFNFSEAGVAEMLILIKWAFLLHAITSAFIFLKARPLPDWDGETERRGR